MVKKKTEPKVDLQKLPLKSANTRGGVTLLLKDSYRQLDERHKRIAELEAELAEAKRSVEISDQAGLRCADDLEATTKRERELRTELVAAGQELVAEKRELEFWVEESDRFRNEVVSLLRLWAKEHPSAEKDS